MNQSACTTCVTVFLTATSSVPTFISSVFRDSTTGRQCCYPFSSYLCLAIVTRHALVWKGTLVAVYGRPLSVSGRPCYILPFKKNLWPPYSPALVNGGSRKFYTWWNLSVIREVTTWIFSWSSLNYRVG